MLLLKSIVRQNKMKTKTEMLRIDAIESQDGRIEVRPCDLRVWRVDWGSKF